METSALSRHEILNVLVRKDPYPPGPLAIYAALYQAGHDGVPMWLLVDRVRWGDASSFRQVLQAISARVRFRTPKEAGGHGALLVERVAHGTTNLALRYEVRDAIDSVPELAALCRTPVAEILATRNPANPKRDRSRWLRLRLRK